MRLHVGNVVQPRSRRLYKIVTTSTKIEVAAARRPRSMHAAAQPPSVALVRTRRRPNPDRCWLRFLDPDAIADVLDVSPFVARPERSNDFFPSEGGFMRSAIAIASVVLVVGLPRAGHADAVTDCAKTQGKAYAAYSASIINAAARACGKGSTGAPAAVSQAAIGSAAAKFYAVVGKNGRSVRTGVVSSSRSET
jgi:hypothetical protein